jgi:hypothetical protein
MDGSGGTEMNGTDWLIVGTATSPVWITGALILICAAINWITSR